MVVFETIAGIIIGIIILKGITIVNQYERAVKLRLGKYTGILEPGMHYVIPLVERIEMVDTRIMTIDIPKQEVMTKDNVPVGINAVIYAKVKDPEKAILNVRDFHYAVSKYGQTSLRNVTGEATLDEVLSEREKIASKLEKIVDIATAPWGIDVTNIELQDIELPESLKRTMAKQAEAEREKRATIINAEGEVIAADNVAKAARTLASAPGALHLRTLQTINDLSSDQSNTVIFAVPLEVLRAFEAVAEPNPEVAKKFTSAIKKATKKK